jgi:hypothetical protein
MDKNRRCQINSSSSSSSSLRYLVMPKRKAKVLYIFLEVLSESSHTLFLPTAITKNIIFSL